jgi:peptidoglycan L-alanyl-D-glutamate endopeptidase CwlK
MKLTARDEAALNGVHPDLVAVIRASAERTFLKWFVNEGLRTPARQHALMAQKRTLTLDSPHLARPTIIDGVALNLGHAVDLVLLNGKAADWTFAHYHALAAEVLEQAARRRIPMRWGGHFRTRTGARFADGLHFELDADFYPRSKIN